MASSVVITATAALGLALGSFAFLGANADRESPAPPELATTSTPAASSASLPVPPPGEIDTVAGLIGAYLRVGDDLARYQIHDAVWGVTHDGHLGYAVLKATSDDGHVIDYQRPDLFERLAYTPRELHGTSFRYRDGSSVHIDAIRYCIDQDGYLEIAQWQGRDRNGRTFLRDNRRELLSYPDSAMPDPLPVCCREVQKTECLSENCAGSCPGPSNCACTAGGSCYLQTGPQCKGACGGHCPAGSAGCSGPPCNCEP
jgi:hypothetical protein